MRENGADVGVGGSTRGRGSARGRGAGWSNTASQDQQAIWSSAGRPIGDTRQNQRRTVSDLMSHHNGPLPIAHTISMDPSITRRPQGKSQLVSGASHAVGGLSGSSTNASRIPKKPFVQRHSKSEYLPERLQGDDPYESDRHHETLKLIRRRPDESHIRTVPSKPPSPPLSKKWSYTRPLPSTLADDADLQPIASSKMEQLAASFLRTSDDPSNNVRPLENGRIRVGAAFLRGATTSTSTSTSSQGLTGEFRGGSAFSMPGLEPRDAGLETFRGEGAAETERRLQEKYGQIGDNHESRSLGPQKELGSRSNGYIYILQPLQNIFCGTTHPSEIAS
ncbi:hypothetical protein BC829DRAFT_258137 [Chytridium lagenaria]|nr:hypothetical protein BC829DRAFT_258137 [Chytridium lagenaria]